MYKIMVFLLIWNTLLGLSCNQVIAEDKEEMDPKVIDINTSPVSIINQWVTLRQRSTGELLIKVDAINTKEVRFWTVPVKNKSWQDSWEHRKLISIDRNGSDGWSTIFLYGNENILSFIVVEAIGHNEKSHRRPFYVIYRK